jgi:ribosomal protein L37AE/L43A
MAAATAALRIPLQCPMCSANGWIQLNRCQQGLVIVLDWSCTNCQHRWAITMGDVVVSAPDQARPAIALP